MEENPETPPFKTKGLAPSSNRFARDEGETRNGVR